ncbi:hypothetical protein IVA95_16630 [Bradyrhizobium sp. 157]|uniref:hypothetical protein n=1 Tax=Bradyrhizobium sp. 157 TaxID=2782631 RepID=UPI001FF753DB|nr:hypothetical protein [Bradyrhizobium sp. 157]MCK1639185.1 hypothetical protein [Bradyrhizobium sp. 157]
MSCNIEPSGGLSTNRHDGTSARFTAVSVPFEILHGAFVLFRRSTRFEGSEITAFAGFRIDFAGIEPVFAR